MNMTIESVTRLCTVKGESGYFHTSYFAMRKTRRSKYLKKRRKRMILIENAQIMGLEPTIRGMRNPMNSWAKSDSGPCLTHGPAHCKDCPYTEESCHATEADFENNFRSCTNR